MFGCCFVDRFWSDGHDDVSSRCRRYVNTIITDTVPCDHTEIGQAVEHPSRDVLRARDHRIGAAQFVLTGISMGLDECLRRTEPGGAE